MRTRDLLHLWLEFDQVDQLRRVNDQLEEGNDYLAQIEDRLAADAQQREDAAQQVQRLAAQRAFVFDISRNLDLWEPYAATLPQPVYIATQAVQHQLQQHHLDSDTFTEFADKAYMYQVEQRLDALVQHTEPCLTQAQYRQAYTYIEMIVHMPYLHHAIGVQHTMRHLATTRGTWQRRRVQRVLRVVLGVCLLLLAYPVGSWVYGYNGIAALSDGHKLVMQIVAVWSILGTAAVGVLLIAIKGRRYAGLKATRAHWQQQLPDPTVWRAYEQCFGDARTDYQQLYQSRDRLIEQIVAPLPGSIPMYK